jgi:hypothetical protein
VPSVEIVFDALIAIAMIALLAIRRRARLAGRAEPVAVSVATGVILGLVASLVGAAVMFAVVSGPV